MSVANTCENSFVFLRVVFAKDHLTTSIHLSGIGNDFSCGTYNFLSFLNMLTINEVPRYTSEITICFRFILFWLLTCRIWFVRFSLKITGVFHSFDILPNSVGWSYFRTFSCQLYRTVCSWEHEIVSFFRRENFFCFDSFDK